MLGENQAVTDAPPPRATLRGVALKVRNSALCWASFMGLLNGFGTFSASFFISSQ